MLSRRVQQDILERSTAAVLKQGGSSIRKDKFGVTEPRYRDSSGRRCAIGHLISDAYYDPRLEGYTFSNSLVSNAVSKSLGLEADSDEDFFLVAIQAVHDGAAVAESSEGDEAFLLCWKMKLKRMCGRFGLRFPEEIFD